MRAAAMNAAGDRSPIYVVENQPIHVSTIEQTCMLIMDRITLGRSFHICTLNLDHLVKLRQDPLFRRVYAEAEIVTADGFPIVLLAALDGISIDRVTGADIVIPLCKAAALRRLKVVFIGPTVETIELCIVNLRKIIPDLDVAGSFVPSAAFDPRSEEAERLTQKISESDARICFVALGAPKQEVFSSFASVRTTGVAFVPVGAALEFLAGTKRRAPDWIRSIGFEWFWRLMFEPSRLYARYFLSFLLFVGILRRRLLFGKSFKLEEPKPNVTDL